MPEESSVARSGAAYGIDLKVSLACPECSCDGQVAWAHLAHGMRCPQCGVRFWLDARGHLRSERRVPRLRFQCLRCGQQEKIPATFATRGIRCPGCRERFLWGPDNSFYGQRELESMQRAARAKAACAGRTRRLKRLRDFAGQRHYPWLFLISLLGAGGLLLALWLEFSGGRPPDGLQGGAERFTRHCLENRLDLADTFVDSHEQSAFRRWLVLHPVFDAYGDRGAYRARATVEEQSAESATVRVVLVKTGGKGSIMQTQCWRWTNGRWLFSPEETIRLLTAPEVSSASDEEVEPPTFRVDRPPQDT